MRMEAQVTRPSLENANQTKLTADAVTRQSAAAFLRRYDWMDTDYVTGD